MKILKLACCLVPLIVTFGGGVWVGWHGYETVQQQPTLRFLVDAIASTDRPFK